MRHRVPPTALDQIITRIKRCPGLVTGQIAEETGICVQTVRSFLIRKPGQFRCEPAVERRGAAQRKVLRWYPAEATSA